MLLLKYFLLLKNTKSNYRTGNNNDYCNYNNDYSNYGIVCLGAISIYDRRKELSVFITASATYSTLSVCNYAILVHSGSDRGIEFTPNVIAIHSVRNRELFGTTLFSTLVNSSSGIRTITCYAGTLTIVVSVNCGSSKVRIGSIVLSDSAFNCVKENYVGIKLPSNDSLTLNARVTNTPVLLL